METCHALAERGHTITLFVRPDTAAQPRDPFAFYGVPPVPTFQIARLAVRGTPRTRRVLYLAAALWRARKMDTDIIVTRDLGVAAALLQLPETSRRSLVYESHGLAAIVGASMGSLLSTATSASARKQRRLWSRERRVWTGAEGYVTITATLMQELEAHFGPRGPAAVVADGVMLQANRTFATPHDDPSPLVAYAGHLYPWKGVDTLLHALVEVPNARGLIVGGHPDEPDLPK